MEQNRRNWLKKTMFTLAAFSIAKLKTAAAPAQELFSSINSNSSKRSSNNMNNMKLGAFSVSLTVKDIHVSQLFYENLGFTVFGGNIKQNWLIMKNEQVVIGLFQGMFEKNMLTFNPGWDQQATKLDSFTDVRKLQQELKAKGLKLMTETDEAGTGPASFMLMDPDGNPVLFDQHV